MAPVWDVWPGGERERGCESGREWRLGKGKREGCERGRVRDKKAKEFQDLELSL